MPFSLILHRSRCFARALPTRRCGADWPFTGMRYGDAWRVRRKAFHTANLPEQVLTYQPGHFSDAALYLRQLLRECVLGVTA
jgi:hypothetical protein